MQPLRVALALALVIAAAAGTVRAERWDPVFANPVTAADFGAAARPFGIGAGDFDEDGDVDLVVGQVNGSVAFLAGNGDGSFAAPVTYAWKLAYFNAWAFGAGDIDADTHLDVVWGANATSTATDGSGVTVNDGDIRYLRGLGDGTFAVTPYLVSGVLHNAGVLIADIGTDAGSLAVGNVDTNSTVDIVAGAMDATAANTQIVLLRNNGGGSFSSVTLLTQPNAGGLGSPIYYPAVSTQNSPWGLALADADDDLDLDLWVCDRALYLYRFENDGFGAFTLTPPDTPPLPTRPNVWLGHDSVRASVGYTASLAAGDINGDLLSDVVLGLQSGGQTPSSAVAHDGEVVLDVTLEGGLSARGALADLGTMARGLTAVDLDDDAYLDLVAGVYEGRVELLRQLPDLDTDGDGVSDYVDNAPDAPNAARIDMNTDGAWTHHDQLDNDFDTVLGDPGDPSTWERLGDPVDPDDDNDLVADDVDLCPLVADGEQLDGDGDGTGDACDVLDQGDADGDGWPSGPAPDDPLYEQAVAARNRWNSGTTRFVLRVDALSRFFQNEFTQILSDAATLSPAAWAAKCWQNYDPGDIGGDPAYEPCGLDEGLPSQTLTLDGGRGLSLSLLVIPRLLWTDPPVIAWVNDRNDNALLEIAQHGSYHANNVPYSDWKDDPQRDFYSCETCGLSLAENFELLRIGRSTLLGDYADAWIAQSGATAASPRIDWTTAANPLISYAPPFNASDTTSRQALAWLGHRSFSASVYEESSSIFSPEGSHHEQFDAFGLFHASADLQVDPPDINNDSYSVQAYAAQLNSITQAGGLNTWLIEEVEWSGRACNALPRLVDCNGVPNREDNTVYQPRWQAWLQLLDHVASYPGGVVLTQGEVALARGFDNCPASANPGQEDFEADGLGDVCDPDDDGDGAGDAADCLPLDAAVFAAPGSVAGVRLHADRLTLEWDSLAGSAGTATLYDVARGRLDELPVGTGAHETCIAQSLSVTEISDDVSLTAGQGVWYLVRGTNACGTGSYGFATGGNERTTTACP